jgi:hypothetical protein
MTRGERRNRRRETKGVSRKKTPKGLAVGKDAAYLRSAQALSRLAYVRIFWNRGGCTFTQASPSQSNQYLIRYFVFHKILAPIEHARNFIYICQFNSNSQEVAEISEKDHHIRVSTPSSYVECRKSSALAPHSHLEAPSAPSFQPISGWHPIGCDSDHLHLAFPTREPQRPHRHVAIPYYQGSPGQSARSTCGPRLQGPKLSGHR